MQRHGRLLPPAGRMYPLRAAEDGKEEGMGAHGGADGGATGREGPLPPPPAFEGALPLPPLPPPPAAAPQQAGAAGLSAVSFDYGSEQPGAGQGLYAAVGFSYGEQEGEQGAEQGGSAPQPQPPLLQRPQQQQPEQEELPFSAPFLVPERLRAHMPATQRQYKVR